MGCASAKQLNAQRDEVIMLGKTKEDGLPKQEANSPEPPKEDVSSKRLEREGSIYQHDYPPHIPLEKAHMFLGVTLWAIQKYVAEFGPSDPNALNGYDFLSNYVKPWLKENGKEDSLCIVLSRMWDNSVGTTNIFVSHAQTEMLALTVAVVERYLRQQEASIDSWYIWLDYFCIKQLMKDFHPDIVQEVIGAIGHTVMIGDPWDKCATITRVWCIFEILQTVVGGAKFAVALPEHVEQNFIETFMSDGGAKKVETALSKIDVQNAQSYRPEDKDTIMNMIHNSVGEEKTNSAVVLALKDAYLKIAEQEAVRKPTTIRVLNQVGVLIRTLTNDGQRRLPYAVKTLQLVEARDGPTSESVATRCENVGSTYNILKDYSKALEYYTRCLDIRLELLGPKSRFVGITKKDLGVTHLNMGKHELARQSLDEALEIFKDCGEAQPLNIAWTQLIMGRNFHALGQTEDSRTNFKAALTTRENRFGKEANHPLVAECLFYYGSFLCDVASNAEENADAHKMLARAQHIYAVNFGADSEKTLEVTAKLESADAGEDCGNKFGTRAKVEK